QALRDPRVLVDAQTADRVRDARLDPDAHSRAARRRERQVIRFRARRRARNAFRDVAILQRLVVEQVPGPRSRLFGSRLHEVVLRPRHLAPEEFLASLVEDARGPAVQLRKWDELLLR